MGNQRLKWRRMVADAAQDCLTGGDDARDNAIPIGSVGGDGADAFRQRLAADFSALAPPARVLLSAVSRSEAVSLFTDWCKREWGIAVESMQSAAEFDGLINDYEDPAQLGCDRWHAAVAARRRSLRDGNAGSVVVVDAGTAVTVDLVSRDHFIGGAIMPGFSTMVQVLGRDTGRIRLRHAEHSGFDWQAAAKNSDDAVRSGSYFAVCGGVDRCIDAQAEHIGEPPQVVFTGGDAALVRDGTRHEGRIYSNLVLDGLAILAQEVAP